jgi:type III secretion protein J
LYTGLEERQANEMDAILQSAGIDSSKREGEGGVWSLSVPDGELARAVQILHARGYPQEKFDSLGQVFEREGFVSSPTEERARLLHALSQELSHTISSMDGVVLARVHLSVPEREPLAEQQPPSSASVFIKHRPEMDLSAQAPQIKALVANGVEGLKYEDVSVMFVPAQPLAMVDAKEDQAPAPALVSALAVIGAAGGAFWMFGRRRKPFELRAKLLTRQRQP